MILLVLTILNIIRIRNNYLLLILNIEVLLLILIVNILYENIYLIYIIWNLLNILLTGIESGLLIKILW